MLHFFLRSCPPLPSIQMFKEGPLLPLPNWHNLQPFEFHLIVDELNFAIRHVGTFKTK